MYLDVWRSVVVSRVVSIATGAAVHDKRWNAVMSSTTDEGHADVSRR